MADEADLEAAAAALDRGELVVYPTETVYGLAADALDTDAVAGVFEAKGRDREKPVSLAVPSVEAAAEHVRLSERERAFAEAFLPGPITLVCERREAVPDVLTAGRDRVGVRVPDHDVALALLDRFAPITATSANRSGAGSVRRVADLHEPIRDAAAVVLDGGETPGGGSTVVDVASGTIHRRGARADAVDDWLEEH